MREPREKGITLKRTQRILFIVRGDERVRHSLRPVINEIAWAPEQVALPAIPTLRSGGHSLRAVAGALNNSGHRTRRGTQWRLESVVRAISQDAAKGQMQVA